MTPDAFPRGEPRLPETKTSHPDNPILEEPVANPEVEITPPLVNDLERLSLDSSTQSESASDSESPSTPCTDPQVDQAIEKLKGESTVGINFTAPQKAPFVAKPVFQSKTGATKLALESGPGTKLVENTCCGGGCCFLRELEQDKSQQRGRSISVPDHDAFRKLQLKLGGLNLDSVLTNVVPVPEQTVYLSRLFDTGRLAANLVQDHPPSFVTPHPPYEVFPARIHHARELTKAGAEKRTIHFELDVTDYPDEGGNVDFVVGGAIGVCPANSPAVVEDFLRLLGVPTTLWDRPVELKTTGGRWPTIWGDEHPRELVTTRKDILTWCSDLQSRAPTKALLRLLAEYATEENEKKILMYLTSAQGQAAFCDLRTGPHVTVNQLLNAFPSSKPPLAQLLSHLPQLMPRFYSLSNDPHSSCIEGGETNRRLIEFAVTVLEMPDWRHGVRTGAGSGYLERMAMKFIEAGKAGTPPETIDVRIPMFRGLMANPLAKEFVSDGPMLLIGAGVGIAPFRGFVQRRLKTANCANKVWVLQGVRDSLLDELYSGEWGVHEQEVKKVVQSRRGEGRYVQEEVRNQADLVWYIINSLDGRVFVCGSTQGMGEGVERALVEVAISKGRMNQHEAEEFWNRKKESGQYVSETW